jgi:hypothetical protein
MMLTNRLSSRVSRTLVILSMTFMANLKVSFDPEASW